MYLPPSTPRPSLPALVHSSLSLSLSPSPSFSLFHSNLFTHSSEPRRTTAGTVLSVGIPKFRSNPRARAKALLTTLPAFQAFSAIPSIPSLAHILPLPPSRLSLLDADFFPSLLLRRRMMLSLSLSPPLSLYSSHSAYSLALQPFLSFFLPNVTTPDPTLSFQFSLRFVFPLPPSLTRSLSLSLALSLSIPTASPPPSSTVYENNTFLRSIHSSSFLFSLSNLAPSFSLPRSRRYTPPCLTNGILPFPLLAVDQSSLFPQRCSS